MENFIIELMSSLRGRRAYFREQVIFELSETIAFLMEMIKIDKTELSKLSGVSKRTITKLLRGNPNIKISDIADILFVLCHEKESR